MTRWLRILKHRWADDSGGRSLPPAALQRLQQRLAASEVRHSGEIRLCIESGLPLSYLWRNATARQRALTLFGKLRVWDTEHNNGVLIYLLMAEHAIELVADRGLSRHVPQSVWVDLVGQLRENFRAGRFEQGLEQAIDAVDQLLSAHFALAEGQANPNELPDQADLR